MKGKSRYSLSIELGWLQAVTYSEVNSHGPLPPTTFTRYLHNKHKTAEGSKHCHRQSMIWRNTRRLPPTGTTPSPYPLTSLPVGAYLLVFLESKVNLILTSPHRHTVSESYKYIDWWQRIWNQYTKVMHAYGDREKTPWTRERHGCRGRQYWNPEYRWYDNHPGMGQSRTQLFSFLLRYAAVNN